MTNYNNRTNSYPCDALIWCRDNRGATYNFEQFLNRICDFHGYPAPGLVIGGKMVDLALSILPRGILFDAIAETGHCLPDAIQLLTPCTVGNGWLKVRDLGRFALALYDKQSGEGVRVCLDAARVAKWPAIDEWFFKRKPKAEQDGTALLHAIREAGDRILRATATRVRPEQLTGTSVGMRAICPRCGESYPAKHGDTCRGCGEASPYLA
jgi:formylmethanofuran dehydrogenase subunit E